MTTDHTDWCRTLYNALAEGGIWGVPRSGLVFTKRDGGLVLTDRMPHQPELPLTPTELTLYQADDYESIREQFTLAGIPVTNDI